MSRWASAKVGSRLSITCWRVDVAAAMSPAKYLKLKWGIFLVRSPTQLYCVGFLQSRISENVVFWQRNINIYTSCFQWHNGISKPSHCTSVTAQFSCFSIVLEEMSRRGWRPLKGAVSAQKALQEAETETRELLIRTEDNNIIPGDEGSLICQLPSRQMNFFVSRFLWVLLGTNYQLT